MCLGKGPVGLVLGSLYPEKRLEFALEVGDELCVRFPNFTLLVIGDGPARPGLEREIENRPWVRMLGVHTGADLVTLASLCDAMINPGVVGLSVLESFALAVPMVTCELASHGPEIAYLIDGVNGVVLPSDSTPIDFAARITTIFRSTSEHAHLVEGCQQSASIYTLEAMTDRFAAGVVSALGATARNSRSVVGS